MNNLRYQLRLIGRHKQYGGTRQALGFALRHWRWWWWGAPPPEEKYTHIGQEDQ